MDRTTAREADKAGPGATARVARVRQVYQELRSIRKTAKALGIGYGTVQKILAECPPDGAATRYQDRGDHAILELTVPRPVTNERDLVAAAGIDLSRWRVARFECTRWTTTMKLGGGRGAADRVAQAENWRVWVRLEPVLPRPLLAAADAVFDRLKARAPRYPAPPRPKPIKRGEPHLLEVDLFDHHFGKLCWAAETGQSYDLRIAERLYQAAVTELLGLWDGFRIDQIVLPLGNDFFHVDRRDNTTTAGTPQDMDSRYAKMVEVGEVAVLRAIEALMAAAPVHVLWVPGNHDWHASYHLARTVAAWFHRAPRVSVDVSPNPYKRVRYGTNLIGYAHGDEIKPVLLPGFMAQQWPDDWAATTCHEWRLGHEHRTRVMRQLATDSETHQGVVLRWLSSLTATDSWHHRRMLTGNRRAAESYLMGFETGYRGHKVAWAAAPGR